MNFTVTNKSGVWLVLALVGPMLWQCGGEASHPTDVKSTYESISRSEKGSDSAVASVDGREVTTDLLVRLSEEASPSGDVLETGIQREAAVSQALEQPGEIDGELLSFARKRGMVRRLLELEVEREVSRESLGGDAIRSRMEQLRSEAGRPEGVEASHLLVKLPERDDSETGSADDGSAGQAVEARAESLVTEITDWLRARSTEAEGAALTLEDLFVARREFEDRLESEASDASSEKLKLVVNPHLRFPAPNAPDWRRPSGWVDVVEPFRKAAGELAAEGDLPRLSEPVRTKYGWHVILVQKRLARKVPDAEALRELAVHRLLSERRREVYDRKIDAWMQRTAYETYPDNLKTEPAGSQPAKQRR